MKRMYIAALIAVALFGLYFIQADIVKNEIDQVASNMAQSVECLNSGDYETSAEKAQTALSELKKDSQTLKIFVDEDRVELVLVHISRFIEFVKYHSNAQACAEYQNYIIALEQIHENATLLGELWKRL